MVDMEGVMKKNMLFLGGLSALALTQVIVAQSGCGRTYFRSEPCATNADCDDQNACTLDQCDTQGSCTHQAVDLDNDDHGATCGGGDDCDDILWE